MNMLEISTDKGAIANREAELPLITDDQLRKWRISRQQLHWCFAEGVRLMQSRKPADWVRPVAFPAISAQTRACARHSSGLPGMVRLGRPSICCCERSLRC